MLLGGVFRAVSARRAATLRGAVAAEDGAQPLDMQRWAALFGVPLTMPSAHPMRTVEALRATPFLTKIDPRVVDGFIARIGLMGARPVKSPALRDVLSAAGHASAIVARLDEAKDELRRRTDEAIALGIFGAPAFVVGNEMY